MIHEVSFRYVMGTCEARDTTEITINFTDLEQITEENEK